MRCKLLSLARVAVRLNPDQLEFRELYRELIETIIGESNVDPSAYSAGAFDVMFVSWPGRHEYC